MILKNNVVDRTIYVAGHRGMVGSAIVRRLKAVGNSKIVTRTHEKLDLKRQQDVNEFFEECRPEIVYLAAAKVGGIYANSTYPAEFIYDNLIIEANIIHAAWEHGVKKLLFLGSSCIYPKLAKQPMSESALLTGGLEPTNEPYALAKISGIKLCESYNRQYGTDFRSVMPTNLYGEGDNFDLEKSHVLPALMRKLHEAKLHNLPSVTVWGTGKAKREFLHVDDLANASLFVMGLDAERYVEETEPMLSHINVGTGTDLTIGELVKVLAEEVGYDGEIAFDTTKPDGAPRKLLDVSRLTRLGWKARIDLRDGIRETYRWFLNNHKY